VRHLGPDAKRRSDSDGQTEIYLLGAITAIRDMARGSRGENHRCDSVATRLVGASQAGARWGLVVAADIERDFQPIAQVTTGHLLLAVAPALPIRSVADLTAHAKKNPGKLSNASSGSGSPGHVSGELFKFMSGTEIVHVPYKGGTAAITDLIAGRVDLMFESLTSIAPHARQQAIRALAVSGAKRSAGFPELPTIAEAGVPGYEAPIWFGVAAPAGTPRPIVDKLNGAINRAIRTEFFKARYEQIGDEPAGGTPEEFATLIKQESAKWADVVKRSGAKLE
jgi:tripartite-type tricarboxylate transporter receptor subunit TctC